MQSVPGFGLTDLAEATLNLPRVFPEETGTDSDP